MSCETARELIHPYIDRELNADRAAEFCRHLVQCEECALGYRNQLTLRSIIKDKSLRYRSPDHLRQRIRSALREEL